MNKQVYDINPALKLLLPIFVLMVPMDKVMVIEGYPVQGSVLVMVSIIIVVEKEL